MAWRLLAFGRKNATLTRWRAGCLRDSHETRTHYTEPFLIAHSQLRGCPRRCVGNSPKRGDPQNRCCAREIARLTIDLMKRWLAARAIPGVYYRAVQCSPVQLRSLTSVGHWSRIIECPNWRNRIAQRTCLYGIAGITRDNVREARKQGRRYGRTRSVKPENMTDCCRRTTPRTAPNDRSRTPW